MSRFPIWGFLLLATALMAASGLTGWLVTYYCVETLGHTKSRWIEFVDGPSSRIMMLGDITRKQGLDGAGQHLGAWLATRDSASAEAMVDALSEIAGDLEIYSYLEPSDAEMAILMPLRDQFQDLAALIQADGSAADARALASTIDQSLQALNTSLQTAYADMSNAMAVGQDRLAYDIGLAQRAIVAATILAIVVFAILQIMGVSSPIMRLVRKLVASDGAPDADWAKELGGCREVVRFIAAYRAQMTRTAEARRSALTQLAFEIQARVQGLVTELVESGDHIRNQSDEMRYRAANQMEEIEQIAQQFGSIEATLREFADDARQLTASMRESEAALQCSQTATRSVASVVEQSSAAIGELRRLVEDTQDFTVQIAAIATQAEMSAIRAASEAERAGHAEGGFAVVASQVRDLAGASAQLTANVEGQLARLAAIGDRCDGAVHDMASMMTTIVETSREFEAALGVQLAASENIRVGSGEVQQAAAGLIDKASSARSAAAATKRASESLRQTAEQVHSSGEGVKSTLHQLMDRLWAA